LKNNELIVEASYRVMRGQLKVPTRAGFCLQMVRLIVEDAFNMPSHSFYRWKTHMVERAPGDDFDPWARDMERSFRLDGYGVAVPQENSRYLTRLELQSAAPGDLLFRWDVARTRQGTFIGHVGILMPGGLVLENINPASRPTAMTRDVTALTSLEAFPVTLAARFRPE